jgi:hypothetical protein
MQMKRLITGLGMLLCLTGLAFATDYDIGGTATSQPDGTLTGTIHLTPHQVPPQPSGPVTWDPALVVPSITLSNGNLTMTQSHAAQSSNTYDAVRSTLSKSNGLRYFETTYQGTHGLKTGIANASTVLSGGEIGITDDTSIALQYGETQVRIHDQVVGTAPAVTEGQTMGVAVDMNANPHLIWFRNTNNPSVWNAGNGAAPGGSGGIPFSFACPCYVVGGAYHSATVTKAMTANYGVTAYKASIPTNYVNWDNTTPPPTEPPPVGGGGGGTHCATAKAGEYCISPTGNDSNNGQTYATAWKTPDHTLACGNRVWVGTGNYVNGEFVRKFKQPTGCANNLTGPNFAIFQCDKTYVGDCYIDAGPGANGIIFATTADVSVNNLLFSGFEVGAVGSTRNAWCVSASGQAKTMPDYIAVIDTYVHDCGDTGIAISGDHIAVISDAVILTGHHHGNSGGGCPSNISISPGPNSYRADEAGVPRIVAMGVFSMLAKANESCLDGHGIIFDTSWTGYVHNGKRVITQSMFLGNALQGIRWILNDGGSANESHNTVWGNGRLSPGGSTGDVPPVDWTESVWGGVWGTPSTIEDDLIVATTASSVSWNCSTGDQRNPCPQRYAIGLMWTKPTMNNSSFINTAAPTQNCFVYTDNGGSLPGHTACTAAQLGSGNVNTDPQFKNVGALPTSGTQINCSNKTRNGVAGLAAKTVYECMLKAGIIDGFTPQNASLASKGYQKPGACKPDPLYPPWLPVSEIPDGVITKPCQ